MANYCNTKDCIDKFNLHKKNEISSPYTRELEFKELTNSQEKVVLETKNLQDLFSSNLVIRSRGLGDVYKRQSQQ